MLGDKYSIESFGAEFLSRPGGTQYDCVNGLAEILADALRKNQQFGRNRFQSVVFVLGDDEYHLQHLGFFPEFFD
jgi:hypothetical protein